MGMSIIKSAAIDLYHSEGLRGVYWSDWMTDTDPISLRYADKIGRVKGKRREWRKEGKWTCQIQMWKRWCRRREREWVEGKVYSIVRQMLLQTALCGRPRSINKYVMLTCEGIDERQWQDLGELRGYVLIRSRALLYTYVISNLTY